MEFHKSIIDEALQLPLYQKSINNLLFTVLKALSFNKLGNVEDKKLQGLIIWMVLTKPTNELFFIKRIQSSVDACDKNNYVVLIKGIK